MNLNILFVEDNAKLAESIKRNLESERISGHSIKVISTTSFSECISLIERNDFDIVLLDLFDDGDEKDEHAGINVLNALRKSLFIPVIFYTGHAYKVHDLKSPIVGVVSKGDGVGMLQSEIQRIIDSNIALIKQKIYAHLRESLRSYFWDIIDNKDNPFRDDDCSASLGYLLLRRFANSLTKDNIKDLLEDTKIKADKTHPMEFYIYPTSSREYESGEILKKDGNYYVILTPDCDFIKNSNRSRKAEKVLLVRGTLLSETLEFTEFKGNPDKKEKLKMMIESRRGDRYFFLPKTPFIDNTVLDYQNKTVVAYDDLSSFKRIAKLDAPFSQSMITSFIRYYNRIGFPDIDSDYIIENLD